MIDLTWYNTLNQPLLSPPAWIFAPVWTVLYISIFVSLILYSIKRSEKNKSFGFLLFFCQLALNLCWTPAFFYFHNIGLALAIVSTMDIFVLFNILEFFKISKSAGFLLIPYFIWILFATYLNFAYFVLN